MKNINSLDELLHTVIDKNLVFLNAYLTRKRANNVRMSTLKIS